MKRLIIFDLDGTLAESKTPITTHMAELLHALLNKTKVGVISGASYSQLASQFLHSLHATPNQLNHLFLLPANGTSLYSYENGWKKEYDHPLASGEIAEVLSAIEYAVSESKIELPPSYGERSEVRGSQITFSALGQSAPLGVKREWDAEQVKRKILKKILDQKLPNFSVSIGGMTSIDITRKGFDKHFGINELMKKLHVPKESTVYIGDALFPGGNDSSALEAGIETVSVKNPFETEEWIKKYLNI